MKKKYVKIMFLSLSLLTISTTATYAVQPEDDKKENEGIFLTAIHHSDFADPIYLQYSFCTIAKVTD